MLICTGYICNSLHPSSCPVASPSILAISRFTISSSNLPPFRSSTSQKRDYRERNLPRQDQSLSAGSSIRASINTGRDAPPLKVDSQLLASTDVVIQPLLPPRETKAVLFPNVQLGPMCMLQGRKMEVFVHCEEWEQTSGPCTSDRMNIWVDLSAQGFREEDWAHPGRCDTDPCQ